MIRASYRSVDISLFLNTQPLNPNTTLLALLQNGILLLDQFLSSILNGLKLLLPCAVPLVAGTVSEPALLYLHTRSLVAQGCDPMSYGC